MFTYTSRRVASNQLSNQSNRLTRFDLAFSIACLNKPICKQSVPLARAISHTGDGHLYALFALMVYLLDITNGELFIKVTLLAFAVELPIYWILKNSFKRRRPEALSPLINAHITPSDQYSLPSGHTAAAFLMASSISYSFPNLMVFSFLWAACIGASRLILGVHFLTDIVLGALLGLSSFYFVLNILTNGF